MNTFPEQHFTIGTIAREAGVGTDTIRYYERAGLLAAPRRRVSGYRDYDITSVARLRFIRRAKALGFSLDDIRDLLTLSVDREHGVRGVSQRAEARLVEIEHRMSELQRVRQGLKSLIAACPGHGPLEHCPILRALGGKEET